MILFPSVDELLKRVDSRYSLIMLASKRLTKLISTVLTNGVPKTLISQRTITQPRHWHKIIHCCWIITTQPSQSGWRWKKSKPAR